jgi:uncharacterized protein (UPF0332 family)
LDAARRDRDEGFTEQACGHAYYAAFYAAQAVLDAAGRTAKTHAGTVRTFTDLLREFAVDENAGALLSQLQKTREDTTYRFLEVGSDDADTAIAKAEQVIAAAREILGDISAEND